MLHTLVCKDSNTGEPKSSSMTTRLRCATNSLRSLIQKVRKGTPADDYVVQRGKRASKGHSEGEGPAHFWLLVLVVLLVLRWHDYSVPIGAMPWWFPNPWISECSISSIRPLHTGKIFPSLFRSYIYNETNWPKHILYVARPSWKRIVSVYMTGLVVTFSV